VGDSGRSGALRLEAELYALLEKLDTAKAEQPEITASLMMPRDCGDEEHQRYRRNLPPTEHLGPRQRADGVG
jgi:hypothetical protein